MKKRINTNRFSALLLAIFLMLGLVFSPIADAVYTTYNCDALTGGAGRALDSHSIGDLTTGDRAICAVSGEWLYFVYDATATAAENVATHPYVVRPDDYGDGNWEEQVPKDRAKSGANVDITSLINAALFLGRDSDNKIDFGTDNTLIITVNGSEAARIDSNGTLLMSDHKIQRSNFLDTGTVTNAIGSIGGGAQTIDLALGNSVSGTVDTSETTFTFSNPTASDELCVFSLVLTNGGSQTVNWPASVDWEGGTGPTLTASGVDILIFSTIDAGTTWHGQTYSLDSK